MTSRDQNQINPTPIEIQDQAPQFAVPETHEECMTLLNLALQQMRKVNRLLGEALGRAKGGTDE